MPVPGPRPAPPVAARPIRGPLWAGLLTLALVPRLLGLGFGLPNRDHAYPYNIDEWTPMRALQQMEPRRLDFNPHYFENPTLFYYLIGAGAFTAGRIGWVRLDGDERFYFDHPEHLARVIVVGRCLTVLFGLATVWLTYRLARVFGLGRGGAGLAAGLLALHPSHVIHSHYMTVNVAVTCATLAALVLIARWLRRRDLGSAAVAGSVAGLALSIKYSAALLLPLLVAAGVARATLDRRGGARDPGRAVTETAAALACAAIAFVAGTPYAVLAYDEFRGQVGPFIHGMASGPEAVPWPRALSGAVQRGLSVHAAASTPTMLLAAIGGAVVVARRVGVTALLVLAWLAVLVVATLRIPFLASDGRFLPAFPVIAVLAAAGIAEVHRRRPRLGTALGAVVVAVALGWTALLVGRFIGPVPQQLASLWARANVGPGERVLHTGTAVYWGPDLVVREVLQVKNTANYDRATSWVFVTQDSFRLPYREARTLKPDVVFLTQFLPFDPHGGEWLTDPDYRLVATFPGKLRLFGRRFQAPLDTYDVDTWVLRPREGAPTAGRVP